MSRKAVSRPSRPSRHHRDAMYLAVVPSYRQSCIDILMTLNPSLQIFTSSAHLDPTVRTGIRPSQFVAVRLLRLGRGLFLQVGSWVAACSARTLIVDLNPRSITAWGLLCVRRLMGRRTLVWGHLYPQGGKDSRTKGLRLRMRRLASGTVTYTHSDQASARADLPDQPVWVAANALYTRAQLAIELGVVERNHIIYVGRFEPAKKVDLAVRAFAASKLPAAGVKLSLFGGGSESEKLFGLVSDLGIQHAVHFPGWEDDFARLEQAYSRAFVSISPGFAGLGLTQSLGFGVPMLVAREEQHSPEIELASTGAVRWFGSDSAEGMARGLDDCWANRGGVPDLGTRATVSETYTADAMAQGLSAALSNVRSEQW